MLEDLFEADNGILCGTASKMRPCATFSRRRNISSLTKNILCVKGLESLVGV
jgi:hypothetical protein